MHIKSEKDFIIDVIHNGKHSFPKYQMVKYNYLSMSIYDT